MRRVDRLVPGFRTVAEGQQAMEMKARNMPSPLYPRDGGPLLGELEARMAGVFGITPEQTLLYPNGVTAVQQALELAHPTRGTTAIFGDEMYSQNSWYMKTELPERGVLTFPVDSGSIRSLESMISRRKPDVILLETVGNASEMKVLPVRQLLMLGELRDIDPLIVLDNSLSTPANLPLMDLVAESGLKVLITESGTKYTGMNEEAMGITYSPNLDLMRELRSRRPRTGTTPSSLAAQERWKELMPQTKTDFDLQVMGTTRNTYALALASAEVQSPHLSVVYPNLESHPNYELARKMFPEGAAPVMFFQVNEWVGVDKFAVLQKFEQNPDVMRYVMFGQSFGFDHTRIWWEDGAPIIRVAGGMESKDQMAELIPAFQESIDSIGKPKPHFVDTRLESAEEPKNILKYGTEGEFQLQGVPMIGQNDCGYAVLKTLGYAVETVGDPEFEGDFFEHGIKVRPVEVEELDQVAEEKLVMINGIKTVLTDKQDQSTARRYNHWVLVGGKDVFDPQDGGKIVSKDHYFQQIMQEVSAGFIISPNS